MTKQVITLPAKYSSLSAYQRRQVRINYVKLQQGLCCFCGTLLSKEPRSDIQNAKINVKLFPDNFFDWPIHLHHDHKTDLTKGAVHNKCNAVLWQYYGE